MREEKIADGVWLLRGEVSRSMNVYFLEDGDGVVQFDGGTRAMARSARRAAERLGGLKRVVLGHAHADHRGTAPSTGAPVYCHPDEVADVESDASIVPYMDLSQLPVPVRWIYPLLLRWWDGGAVKIAGTIEEGDEVAAGFRVLHFPGHAPGLIGLWRESDRVALVSDVVYCVDSARLRPLPHGEASVPHPAWAWNHSMSKQSVLRLAALEPRLVGTGHAEPLRGPNLREVLERAAEKH